MNSETWRIAARCLYITVAISLTACQPGTLPRLPSFVQQLPSAPAQPSAPPSTLIPLPSPPATSSPTALPTNTLTFTPIPSLTAASGTETAVIAPSATGGTPGATGSPTLAATQGSATATLAEGIVIDTLPAGTRYIHVRIENASHSQMDISLHCTTKQGLRTILEYNNVKNIVIEAPEGDYVYVVYVGGRKIVGGFSLLHVTNAVITVYSDRVAIH